MWSWEHDLGLETGLKTKTEALVLNSLVFASVPNWRPSTVCC